jgi:adenylate cyclase
MVKDVLQRRLAAVLAADVVGYSRLMGQDETGTFATLKAYRELTAERIVHHRGRVVNTAGDSILAEFPSVVKAVECAVEIQRTIAERNAALEKDRQMWFRIGVNLGDVLVEQDDLYGEGVNIAARLQALADPGGVLISGPVFDQVKDKLALGFDYLGPQAVKNIAAEVPVYRVQLQPGAATPPERPPPAPSPDANARAQRRHRVYISAARAGTFIFLLFAINMLSDRHDLWFQWPALAILVLFALRATHLLRPDLEK